MENPLRQSLKINAGAARPIARAPENVSTPMVVSGVQKMATMDQPVVSLSAQRPQRILVTATSREDAVAQARQVAAKLSRELHTVDLRQVESKYIHETEKNLLAMLDAAAEADAVLLFDEADALFGKRSEIREAHDRYANLEPAYFLEQIENYPGTVIIATSQPERLDRELLIRHAFSDTTSLGLK